MSDEPLFPPGSMSRRIDGERMLLLGGCRALLMQLAHPLVAKGVFEHSDYRNDPTGRLHRTLQASYGIVFGTRSEAARISASLAKVHAGVRGEGYTATDPALAMWVHATLVDTSVVVHRRFLRGLSDDELAVYYEETKVLGELFGVPASQQPPTWPAFETYVAETVAGLEVSDEARRVGRLITRPRVPLALGPLAELGKQLTAGLLPPPLRAGFGLTWDPLRGAALETAAVACRLLVPRIPPGIRRAD